jgi:hypothetical protein
LEGEVYACVFNIATVDSRLIWTAVKRNPDSDQQFNEPEQTSLSFLPALRFTSARTERESGRIIVEQIIANNPDKDIVYSIMIITPANQYEKNEKLWKEIVDGFRYVPSVHAANH